MAESGNLGSIYFTVEADTAPLVNSEKTLNSKLDRLNQRIGRTDKATGQLNTRMKTVSRSVKEAATETSRLTGFLKAYISLQGARYVGRMADEWQGMENRLRLVTKSNEDLIQSQQNVFDIAQATSQSLGSVGMVYQRIAENADQMGLSLSGVSEIVEIVSKSVAISGATAQAAEAALVQFGQGLAANALRGQELNSVLEQTPGLARALADGLGVPIGQLRTMAEAGELTAETVIGALRAASDSVDEKFATRVKTIGQSFQELDNALTKFVGETSKASGAGQAIVSVLDALANNLDIVLTGLTILAGALAGKYVLAVGSAIVATKGLAGAQTKAAASSKRLLAAIGGKAGILGAVAAGTFLYAESVDASRKAAFEAANPNLQLKVQMRDIEEQMNKTGEALNRYRDTLRSLENSDAPTESVEAYKKIISDTEQNLLKLAKAHDDLKRSISGDGPRPQASASPTAAPLDENAEKRLQSMRNEIALLGQVGEARERLAAVQALGDEASDSQKQEASRLSAQIYQIEQQIEKEADLKAAREENLSTLEEMQTALSQLSMSAEDLAQAKAAAQLNEFATPEEIERAKQLALAIYQTEQAQAKQNDMMAEGAALKDEVQTDLERLNSTVSKYLQLLQAGAIDQETFNRAVANSTAAFEEAQKKAAETTNEMTEFAKQASRNIQSALGDTLYNVLDGNFDNIGDAFGNMLKRMAAELAASAVLKAVGTGLSGQGGILGAIGGGLLNGFDSGGYTGGTSASQVVGFVHGKEGVLNAKEVQQIGGEKGFNQLRQNLASYGGGRQNGGNVSPGKFYRVNETGAPEILNTGGKQYLMMNQAGGRVEPLSSGAGGSNSVVVQININSDGTTQTQAPSGMESFGKEIGEFVDRKFYELVTKNKRQGGALWDGGKS